MISCSTVDNFVLRKSFRKSKSLVPVPNLIEVQSDSFNEFVQLDFLPEERKNIGLEKAFRDIFPIECGPKISLDYVSYELGTWACSCGGLAGITNRYTWKDSVTGKMGCSRLDRSSKTKRYIVCATCHSRVELSIPFSVQDCRDSEKTFAFTLKVKVQLITWDIDEQENKTIHDIKEQDVYFTDVPVMVDSYERNGQYRLGSQGTFVINGVDRVVVSQLHKSSGVVFSKSKKTKDLRGRPYYFARIIPMRGSWLDFEFDTSDCLYVRIDKKKKVLVTAFLQALGISREEILPKFYDADIIHADNGIFYKKLDANLIGLQIVKDMLPAGIEADFVGTKVTEETLKSLTDLGIDRVITPSILLLHKVARTDIVDPSTGEIIVEQGEALTEDSFLELAKHKNIVLDLVNSHGYTFQPTIATSLSNDSCKSREDALHELHAKVWPGDVPSIVEVKDRLDRQFFSGSYYDLAQVGRVRMNSKLGLSISKEVTTLTLEDILATIKYLIDLRERGLGELDDIDHLGNRRVRLVGELLGNQVYSALSRIERIAKERFRMQEAHNALMPQDFLNIKPLSAVLREFFGSSQLSQFMDQTNPLAELAHKRRLSALGPGGVMKDRATYEVRDVHNSHYGRICPIETPEGQTIGLISSLATYAMVNDLGFIESSYRPVKNGKIEDEVVFLDAFEESSLYIAQADAADEEGKRLVDDKVIARHAGNFILVDAKQINAIDLSPQQLVSVAAALIPFLEHDDASRALMGANMQRQAVPLILPQAPLVGTGMESEVARSSGAAIIAERSGVVRYVSSDEIIVASAETDFSDEESWVDKGIQTYRLKKFNRSSYSTWIHQRPIVKVGDNVCKGEYLTDGTSLTDGELALGANLTVAFMPWRGYNFEDAIVLSQRLVVDNVLTSISIDEFTVEARDTKLGPEEITRDIPNVSEKALAPLDEYGIIQLGSRVVPGDILVGKVTLKGDVQYSPEEKLLRAIFGEKSREVRDTSLRVPPGVEGTVSDIKIFSRSGARKDKRYKEDATVKVEKLERSLEKLISALLESVKTKMADLLHDQKPVGKVSKDLVTKDLFDREKLLAADMETIFTLKCKESDNMESFERVKSSYETKLAILKSMTEEKIAFYKKGDDLPSGVIKVIKVYITSKRPISVGDKIAGRHGNKGIISNILPREDMPYLDNGQSVDIILNPLGVPSRMNVGQILETVLGYAGKKLGVMLQELVEQKSYDLVKASLEKIYGKEIVKEIESCHKQDGIMEFAQKTARQGVHFEIPIFQGPDFEAEIQPLLVECGLSQGGTYKIRDGRTGDHFDQPVTIGTIYMMKLNHMVDDKLHARSVGPYSLITQQPLGGKANFGGQRFGEMEGWALEAYGAAYTFQEMLTYKSDDVIGRHKVYETIVRGTDIPDPGIPESFNVLVKELQSLGLQIDLFKAGREELGV
ncbi:MAG: DNA-directed RNA polymerase subunit beta [Candidatus Dependentiae bacterium]|nr:DNA-directed RNA polymerase subunit beta [Candidatus Dependentiae bacterium]